MFRWTPSGPLPFMISTDLFSMILTTFPSTPISASLFLSSANLNVRSAKPNADGSYTIKFSNTKGTNTLDIGEGWNYLIRFYEPKRELLSGEWEIPKPELINQLL